VFGIIEPGGLYHPFTDGRVAHVTWAQVAQVDLFEVDRDDRFFWEDAHYWALSALDGTHWTVYSRHARKHGLLKQLEAALPGFVRGRAVQALRTRATGVFWQRAIIACPQDGGPMIDAPELQPAELPWDRILRCPGCGTVVTAGYQRWR
jgi:hypothetical protein